MFVLVHVGGTDIKYEWNWICSLHQKQLGCVVTCFECVIENDKCFVIYWEFHLVALIYSWHGFNTWVDKRLMQIQFTAECFMIFMMHVPFPAAWLWSIQQATAIWHSLLKLYNSTVTILELYNCDSDTWIDSLIWWNVLDYTIKLFM